MIERMRSASYPMLSLAFLAIALLPLLAATVAAEPTRDQLRCGVCETLVDEVNYSILSSTKTHSVQTRFRVDEKKHVPYARTEHNLLEILESDDFLSRFDRYGVVKPHTKTATWMKRAYELKKEGKEIEPMVKKVTKTATVAADAATPTPADATVDAATPAADSAAAAATPSPPTISIEASDADPAAAATSTPPPPPPASDAPHVAFQAAAPDTPLSLTRNHYHLVLSSQTENTGLTLDSSSSTRTTVREVAREFLDEYLDEAMLMFHRDVPQLKEKLCVEMAEVCTMEKRKQRKTGGNEKEEKKKGKKSSKKEKKEKKSDAETAKDEL